MEKSPAFTMEFCLTLRPKDYELIKSNLDADVKIFENAGHILEIENDIGASIDNVKRCISEVYSFLSK